MSHFSVQIGQMTNQSERMHSRPRPFCAVLRLCRYLSRKFRKSKSLWNEHSNCAHRAGAEQQQQQPIEEEDQQPEGRTPAAEGGNSYKGAPSGPVEVTMMWRFP
uniref:(northern house mosquito) hypothetical protein n=1 Tax=Culex pipiens TaxID=7175 RepID=A0A8D8FPH3_CULPI